MERDGILRKLNSWLGPALTVGGWFPPEVVTVILIVALLESCPSLAVSLMIYTPPPGKQL